MANSAQKAKINRTETVVIPTNYFGNKVPLCAKRWVRVSSRFLKYHSMSSKKGEKNKYISALKLPKNSTVKIHYDCPNETCRETVSRSPKRISRGVYCSPCSYKMRGKERNDRNLRQIERKRSINFLEVGDCKAPLRYKKKECNCENVQTPDQINQYGPANCIHTYQPFWSYLEVVIREYLGGRSEVIKVNSRKKTKVRRLDCVTDAYVFEIKVDLNAIKMYQTRFDENMPIYKRWADSKGLKYAVLVGQEFRYPCGYGRHVYPLSMWPKFGFSKTFMDRMNNLREEWLGSSSEMPIEYKRTVKKYIGLTKKLRRILTSAEIRSKFNKTEAQVLRILGRGKRISIDEIRDTYKLDFPTKSEPMAPSKVVPAYLTLVNNLDRIPSESEIHSNLRMGRARVYFKLTGNDRAKVSDVIEAVFRLTGRKYDSKGRSAGLDDFRLNELRMRQRDAFNKYSSACSSFGSLIPLAYCGALGISRNHVRSAIVHYSNADKVFYKKASEVLKLNYFFNNGNAQQFVYNYGGKLYGSHALHAKLGVSNKLYINSLFTKNGSGVIYLPKYRFSRNGKNNPIMKPYRGKKLLRIGSLSVVLAKMVEIGKIKKIIL